MTRRWDEGEELHMRAKYRTDGERRLSGPHVAAGESTTPVPTDGPVGHMLEDHQPPSVAPGAHTSSSSRRRVTKRSFTHIFDRASLYLDSDTVFAVKDSLITDFTERTTQDERCEAAWRGQPRSPRSTTTSC